MAEVTCPVCGVPFAACAFIKLLVRKAVRA